MNQFEMVVLIVAIVMIAGVFKAKYGYGRRRGASAEADPKEQAKERIQVLERITVEKENTLSKQIEELRDR